MIALISLLTILFTFIHRPFTVGSKSTLSEPFTQIGVADNTTITMTGMKT